MSEQFSQQNNPFDEEKTDPISSGDIISHKEKEAYLEMQRRVDLEKNEISEDPQMSDDIEKIIETLPDERQKEIVRRVYLLKEKQVDVARQLKISPSRARQIGMKAMRLLRHPERIKALNGLDLKSRSGDRYHNLLSELISNYLYKSKVESDKMVDTVLRQIYYLTWGNDKRYLNKLDSVTFNQICDELKTILEKDSYSEQDVIRLRNVKKRLGDEIARIKGLE